MKKLTPKILSWIVIAAFMGAIFCSLGYCPGTMKMADTSQDCSCCKCIDTVALVKADHKNQIRNIPSDFAKAFPLLAALGNRLSFASRTAALDYSPAQTASNATPIYILNRVLRL